MITNQGSIQVIVGPHYFNHAVNPYFIVSKQMLYETSNIYRIIFMHRSFFKSVYKYQAKEDKQMFRLKIIIIIISISVLNIILSNGYNLGHIL